MIATEHPQEVLHRIAMSMVPGVNAEVVRYCKAQGISPADFMTLSASKMSHISDAVRSRVRISERPQALERARQELEFVIKNKIHTLFLTDPDYPRRLQDCPDAPVVLYVLGNPNLDNEFAFSMVGTRNCTPYGTNFAATVVRDLGRMLGDVLVVSGLAYGIDATAHKASLQNDIRTAAVLAHGLHMIYPAMHRGLASDIIKKGGALITEYPSGTTPFRNNFLARNRIVAGLSHAVIIAESDIKGGAMSTARMALSYGREVLALPGRATDTTSRGCNKLIHENTAALVQNAEEILRCTGWQMPLIKEPPRQPSLFDQMTQEQQAVHTLLSKHRDPMSIDEIQLALGLKIQVVMTLVSDMEYEGWIVRHPGNRYAIAL